MLPYTNLVAALEAAPGDRPFITYWIDEDEHDTVTFFEFRQRACVEALPPKGARADDLLDALACAAIARRIVAGVAEPFPVSPGHDAFGLRIAIWA